MNKLLTTKATSISEFKDNPNAILKEANGEPFVVLNNNKPSFYVIRPELYESIAELLLEIRLAPTINKRLSRLEKAISVNIKDL
jgi:antitoxin StbD